MARRQLPDGAWEKFTFQDYEQTETKAHKHRAISMGICPEDGTLHMAFDHHVRELNYRRSVTGLLNDPGSKSWDASQFQGITNRLGADRLPDVTYVIFITAPSGKMYLSRRSGSHGNGDQWLYEYSNGSWTTIGKYIEGDGHDGTTANSYMDDIVFDDNGRLHASWIWRKGAVSTCFDICYAYSDNNGRTWFSSAGQQVGTTNADAMARYNDPDRSILTVVRIEPGQLINQEGMIVDSKGRPHIVHALGDKIHHFYRDASGTWHTINCGISGGPRRQIVADGQNNVYIMFASLKIAMATEAGGYKDWKVVNTALNGQYSSDPLFDRFYFKSSHVLSMFLRNSSTLRVADFKMNAPLPPPPPPPPPVPDTTWNGATDAIWATESNWSASPVPGTGNVATFNSSGNGNTTIDLGAGINIAGLTFDSANAAAYTLGVSTAQTLQLDGASSVTVGAGVIADQAVLARINLGITTSPATQTFNFSNASTEADLILGELVRRASSVNQRRNAEVNVSGDGDVVMGQLRLEGTQASGVMKLFKSGDGTLTLGQGAGDVDNRLTNLESLIAGTVVLDKASSATVHALGGGTHVINGGTLQLAGTGGNQISDTGIANITDDGVFDLNGRNEALASLSGDATGSVLNTANSTQSTLTVGATGGSGSFGGMITDNAGGGQTGTVALVKTGSGTATLSGENTYTRATTINAGVLSIDGSLAAASTVIVNAAGTLAGTGTVNGAVGGVGSIAPGVAGIGTLTTGAADLTMASLVIGIDGSGSGKLVSTGNITLGGPLVVNVGDGGFTEASYVIAEAAGVTGTFSGTPPGFTVNYTSTQAILELSPDPYLTWIAGFGDIPLDQRGPNDDPDGDGAPNFREFALNGDPSDGSNNGLTAVLLQGIGDPAEATLTLIAAVRQGAVFGIGDDGVQTTGAVPVEGLVYRVEGSLDLIFPGQTVSKVGDPSATAPSGAGLPDLTGTDWRYQTFSLDASAGLPGTGFLRMNVSKP